VIGKIALMMLVAAGMRCQIKASSILSAFDRVKAPQVNQVSSSAAKS
jgi:hypothetical protein